MAANLSAHGYRVAEAGDVRSALASWEAGRPDVILLDLGLPDADGLVLIRRVRRDATTPILVLSARDGETDKVDRPREPAPTTTSRSRSACPSCVRGSARLLRRSGGPGADPEGRLVTRTRSSSTSRAGSSRSPGPAST